MSDFYQKVAQENPEIRAELEARAREENVELTAESLNSLTTAVVAMCMGETLDKAVDAAAVSPAAKVTLECGIS